MLTRWFALALVGSLLMSCVSYGEEAERPVIVRVEVTPKPSVFDAATRAKPLELESAEAAGAYFDEAQLAALNKQVDWESQTVLVFAWRGSGQDRFAALVEEKDGKPVVRFVYTPGMTRDLRPHIYVYAVKAGVAWAGP